MAAVKWEEKSIFALVKYECWHVTKKKYIFWKEKKYSKNHRIQNDAKNILTLCMSFCLE
jgi:hypothetical protein